ncbi:MAG: hypothetical protein RLZZ127_2819 [Planctomycetota bacterium]|jgi:hypothetical protein
MTIGRGWWILGAMGAAIVALAVSGIVWWCSTADLDAVAERARGMGIRLRSEEVRAHVVRDPGDIALLEAIDALASEASMTEPFTGEDFPGGTEQRILRSGPGPDPLVVMAIAHGDASMARFRAAVDAVPARPLRVGTSYDLELPRIGSWSAKEWVQTLIPWIRGGDEPIEDLARGTHLVDMIPRGQMYDDYTLLLRVRAALMTVALGRWADCAARPDMVAAWSRWRDEPVLPSVTVVAEQQWLWRTHVDYGQTRIAEAFWYGFPDHWLGALAVRRGRAAAMEAHLELAAVLSATTAEGPRRAAVKALNGRVRMVPRGWRRLLFDPVASSLEVTTHPLDELLRDEARQRILAGLLVALIRREPIPVDPTDPARKPLRRYERNGELIGYYACGDDGVDDGGTTDDWRFPFDRPWDPPASP